MEIKIVVADKVATAPDNAVIVCGNNDYIIEFVFDEDWDGYEAKTARFTYIKNGKRIFIDEPFVGNTCPVPVLSNIGRLDIGVYAGDLKTTTAAVVKCKKSILCNGGTPDEPDEDIYGKIMELLNAKLIDPNTPVDQIFNPESENPQSGKALGDLLKKTIVGYDPELAFSADTVFSTEAIFEIVAYIDLFLKGLAEEKESKDNKVTEIDKNSTDEQYASAKAVVDYVDEKTIKTLEGANVWKLEAGAYFVNGNVLYATPDPPVSPNTIFLNGEKCLLIVTVDPLENNKRYFYLFAKGKIYFGYSKSNGVFGDVELTEGAINGEFAKVTNTITAKNPDEIPSTEAVINYVDTTIGGIENGSY